MSFLSSNVYAEATPEELRKQFVEDMVSEHNFDRAEVEALLNKAKMSDTVLEAIQRPWEAKPWHQYYPIFLTEKRVQKGVEFWNSYADDLQRAEAELGVPAEMIVAIIGVETFYGTYKGKYSVLDALFTLGFHYPPRAKFFRSELQQYMLLSREENFDPLELKGSYAGAMGLGQFISSSYRHYAIDFDGDGVRDLLNNPVDAIGSVANYFKKHGWKKG
ncbi:MAG: lytic murein transglycosylase B, partial [Pseudomonadota bacterium]